ncbi:MAG: ABC transporter ATP-binding protein [Pseudomonadota bacterium]
MATEAPGRNANLLEVRGLTKLFGELRANDGIDLKVKPSEIHALLGENGAGKSTLVKILFGSLKPTSGQILWKSQPVDISSPAQARAIGIGMVFQHFSLFEALTVAENIALSMDQAVSLDNVSEQAAVLSREYGLPLDPKAHVADLSVGERQRIEIVRTLLQNPELIILDEPTSVLTPQEADKLFETLAQIRSEGRSVLYISHRLEEVQRICDWATVLRHGKRVAACDPGSETPATLAKMMVGSEVKQVARPTDFDPGQVMIETRQLTTVSRSPFSVALKAVDLEVRAGEILCIAGVAGNGQSELFDVLSGEELVANPADIRMLGTDVGRKDISERRLLGSGFVPEERRGHAAVASMSLSENMVLARHASDATAFLTGGPLKIIRYEAALDASERVIKAMDVRKTGPDPDASSLSGGNLQKFIVGRELDRRPAVMVVNQPTWGVDAGAARRIRQALIDLAKTGSAVIVISQDLDEIFEVATSVAVINEGRLTPAEPVASMTLERIGLLMGGIHGNTLEEDDDLELEAAHAR